MTTPKIRTFYDLSTPKIRTFYKVCGHRYDDVGRFSEGFAQAILDGKQFHIGEDGKPAYAERFDKVQRVTQDVALVELDGREFYIDMSGKEASGKDIQWDVEPA